MRAHTHCFVIWNTVAWYVQVNLLVMFDKNLVMHADVDIPSGSKATQIDKLRDGSSCTGSPSYVQRNIDPQSRGFLRTNWQIQGYLLEQADAIERQVFFCLQIFHISFILFVIHRFMIFEGTEISEFILYALWQRWQPILFECF